VVKLSDRPMVEHGGRFVAGRGPRGYLGRFGKMLSGTTWAGLRSARNQHVVTLLMLPILLVWANYNIVFGLPEGVDNFVYSGFHLHLPEFLSSRFGDTYYASRIPWNALGYVAHRLLDTERALYAEHIFIFYVAAFSLYSAVSTIFANRSAAFAAAMLFGTNSWFLVSIGRDYVDGSYIACLLLSLATMAGAAFWRRWRLAAIGWGAAVALTVSLYVLLIILVPIEIGMFLCLNRMGQRRNVYLVAALGLIGAVGTTVCLGCISWFAGGKLLYLLPQITILPAVAANRFSWDTPLNKWLWKATYLFIPGAIWAFSAIWAVLGARSAFRKLQSPEGGADINGRLWIACVFCISGFLAYVALQASDIHVLDASDKASALFPFVFVVLCGILAAGRRELSQDKLIYTLTIIAVTLGPWIASGFELIAPPPEEYFSGPIAAIGWVASGSLILWIPFVSGQSKYLLVPLFFSVVGFGATNTDFISFPPDPFYKQARLAIFEASRDIAPYNPEITARFWFDANDPLFMQFQAVASTYLYQYSLINENFPSLTSANGSVSSIVSGDRVIILTSGDNPFPAANRAIADKNLVFCEVASRQIRREGIAFMFVVADAVPIKCR
jgi:hypothetical protein